jgi:hypothetical protein
MLSPHFLFLRLFHIGLNKAFDIALLVWLFVKPLPQLIVRGIELNRKSIDFMKKV